ncbi:MAG TPA: hypothetical protein VEB60_02910 [Candidatus Paceibacterota bacterium]|nr:hypothetical protein [Candidatus Paceibacterota bacterium]
MHKLVKLTFRPDERGFNSAFVLFYQFGNELGLLLCERYKILRGLDRNSWYGRKDCRVFYIDPPLGFSFPDLPSDQDFRKKVLLGLLSIEAVEVPVDRFPYGKRFLLSMEKACGQ